MVYVDSDGVIADFDGWVGKFDKKVFEDKALLYRTLVEHYKEAYLDFNEMPDAAKYLAMLKEPDCKVLTAVPKYKSIASACNDFGLDPEYVLSVWRENKYIWFEKRGVPREKVIVISNSSQKAKFCKKGDILYDDYWKNIDSWTDAGGIGFLVGDRKDC